MANPKTKGAGFERQVAKELEDLLGIRFDRNPFEQQRQANQPDLVTRLETWPFSIECKRYKRRIIYAFLVEAITKRGRGAWKISLRDL